MSYITDVTRVDNSFTNKSRDLVVPFCGKDVKSSPNWARLKDNQIKEDNHRMTYSLSVILFLNKILFWECIFGHMNSIWSTDYGASQWSFRKYIFGVLKRQFENLSPLHVNHLWRCIFENIKHDFNKTVTCMIKPHINFSSEPFPKTLPFSIKIFTTKLYSCVSSH